MRNSYKSSESLKAQKINELLVDICFFIWLNHIELIPEKLIIDSSHVALLFINYTNI